MKPCQCSQYAFPHRAGGGKCKDPGPKPDECLECSFAGREHDPYATGDRWYSILICQYPGGECPWGIN